MIKTEFNIYLHYFYLFCITSVIILFTGCSISRIVIWDGSALKYDDFRGHFIGRKIAAKLYCGIGYNLHFDKNGLSYRLETYAYYVPRRSVISEKTAYVLEHEQNHFKIAYIASVELYNYIDSLIVNRVITYQNHNKITSTKYSEFISTRYFPFDNKYDYETEHSLDTINQAKWNLYIDSTYRYAEQKSEKAKWKSTPVNIDILK